MTNQNIYYVFVPNMEKRETLRNKHNTPTKSALDSRLVTYLRTICSLLIIGLIELVKCILEKADKLYHQEMNQTVPLHLVKEPTSIKT